MTIPATILIRHQRLVKGLLSMRFADVVMARRLRVCQRCRASEQKIIDDGHGRGICSACDQHLRQLRKAKQEYQIEVAAQAEANREQLRALIEVSEAEQILRDIKLYDLRMSRKRKHKPNYWKEYYEEEYPSAP